VARDARSKAAGRPIVPAARRGPAARPASVRGPARRRAAPGGVGVPAGTGPSGEGLVVGATPLVARVSGALLILAAATSIAALFPTYLVVGGHELSAVSGFGGALVALLVPAAHLAVGVVLVRGVVPKFGLAYAGVAGALAVGQLLIEIYRGSSSTTRPAVEVITGQRVLTSGVDVRPGWVLGVVALVLVVAAGVAAMMGWGRTLMEDAGALDPVRPGLAGAAVLLGVLTVLSLALPAVDVPDHLVTDPTTGFQTVVTSEGPQALLERPGLALLGGMLLAGAVLLCSVVAPSLRPRLAAVGGLLAIAVAVLAAAMSGVRDAAASPELEWTVPGAGLVLAGLGYTLLTGLAWRLRRAG
jgi:hypothetical protein